jgi:hypothetical protein
MGWFDTALTIGAGLFGASQGGGSTATTQVDEPWSGAQPFMTDVMQQGQGLYNQTMGMGPFTGGIYATMNPMQRAALGDKAAFAAQGGAGAQNMFGLADRFGGAAAGAGDLYKQAGAMAGKGPGDIYAGLQDRFGSGMKAAAGRDIARNLYEGQIPQNDLAAAAAGAGRGSRAGAMEGVLRRGANDRLADIGAQVDADLMSAATAQWGQGMSGLGGAAGGLAGLGGQAAGMYGSGYGLGSGAINDVYGAGGMFQQDQQMALDAERRRFEDFQLGSWAPLQNYSNLVGQQSGQGGTSTMYNPNPSRWQSGLQSAGAMYGMLQ